MHLDFLPPYAPELNPVEYLWAHWKHHELANFCPKDFAELTVHARAKLRRTQRRKTLIAAFWKQAELPISCNSVRQGSISRVETLLDRQRVCVTFWRAFVGCRPTRKDWDQLRGNP